MKRQVVIHDLPPGEAEAVLATIGERPYVFPASPPVKHCIGCFGCWTKTPGVCVIQDRHAALLNQLAACDRVIVISRCLYGGLSPEVKRVWDRCIGHVQPFFYIEKGSNQMHHVPRYPQAELHVHFWGEVTDRERCTARRLVEGNALNFHMRVGSLAFYPTPAAIRGVLS